MAKNPIPKTIAGVRIPKRVRKSKTLKSLLKNPVGREIVAGALTAGATAAAALVRDHGEVAKAAGAGAKKAARAGGVVSAAIHEATRAVIGVVSEAAHAGSGRDRRGGNDARH